MTDTESSSADSTLILHLRSRRVPKLETDAAKRCKIVPGWPATKEVEKHSDKRQPVEADYPNYSDKETEDDDYAFERQRVQTAAELQALEDEMHARYGGEIDAMREEADRTRQQLADELLLRRLSMRVGATSTPGGG